MTAKWKYWPILFGLGLLFGISWSSAEEHTPVKTTHRSHIAVVRLLGHIEDQRLVECSGMDTSLKTEGLLWAINDGGHGPSLYKRHGYTSCAEAFEQAPQTIPLTLPQDRNDFRQREAICFTPGPAALLLTSEGRGTGRFRVNISNTGQHPLSP